jgi:hypothetical protein
MRRIMMSIVPALRPKPGDMLLDGGWVTFVQPFLINRNITAMTSLFWPTVLAVSLLAPTTRRQHWWFIGLVPIVAGILGSTHATSKIAFVGATIVFATFQFAPRDDETRDRMGLGRGHHPCRPAGDHRLSKPALSLDMDPAQRPASRRHLGIHEQPDRQGSYYGRRHRHVASPQWPSGARRPVRARLGFPAADGHAQPQ